jgi:uncharacterized protein (DUF4213/DUF364 family)
MGLTEDLLASACDGEVIEVHIGPHWTAVVAGVHGRRRCGLASTLHASHEHSDVPDVAEAGQLTSYSGRRLASLLCSDSPLRRSIGGAALNALLPAVPDPHLAQNAGEVLASLGAGKAVALVGRFPFAARVREQVRELTVLELDPQPGEFPESAATEVIPRADIVAITGMTLLNHTLERLLALASPEALVLILGPTTPLSPVLYDYGADLLSGSMVTDIESVVRAVSEGATFRQVHKAGVNLITVYRPGLPELHRSKLG